MPQRGLFVQRRFWSFSREGCGVRWDGRGGETPALLARVRPQGRNGP
jgi:hypothetical protein